MFPACMVVYSGTRAPQTRLFTLDQSGSQECLLSLQRSRSYCNRTLHSIACEQSMCICSVKGDRLHSYPVVTRGHAWQLAILPILKLFAPVHTYLPTLIVQQLGEQPAVIA